MISGYAIILEEKILYCSNESKYTSFEIVVFVEKLIASLNPKHTWLLNSIYLKGYGMGKERILIKHIYTENNENLFFCIAGDFQANSPTAFQMLEEFYIKINEYYKNTRHLKQSAGKSHFNEILEIATDFLSENYEDILNKEEKLSIIPNSELKNNILYFGISSQGLPIISHVYSRILLDNLGVDITEENVELLSSSLSAKLATIAMNTVIRAKTTIREIHIDDMEDQKGEKLILFGDINNFTLDFFASGDYSILKTIFKKLQERLLIEEVLLEEFTGDLKKYRFLHKKIMSFYEEGL
ncbi:MAG: hypothetical protein ACTSR8_00655 [Promethearchaeota archaeon]